LEKSGADEEERHLGSLTPSYNTNGMDKNFNVPNGTTYIALKSPFYNIIFDLIKFLNWGRQRFNESFQGIKNKKNHVVRQFCLVGGAQHPPY
jgi:hypothetical protein